MMYTYITKLLYFLDSKNGTIYIIYAGLVMVLSACIICYIFMNNKGNFILYTFIVYINISKQLSIYKDTHTHTYIYILLIYRHLLRFNIYSLLIIIKYRIYLNKLIII